MKVAIFDMDGTLVDNDAVAIHAALDGLREHYDATGSPGDFPTAEYVRSLVGLPSAEYFARMLPEARRHESAVLAERIEAREVERLASGEGRMFDGVSEVLADLRRDGWRLGLVSNCGSAYFRANLEHLLDPAWFGARLCLGDGPSKEANVRSALAELGSIAAENPGSPTAAGVMVGDRLGDIEAGRANGLRTIASTYGFGTAGELREADAHLASIRALPELLRD